MSYKNTSKYKKNRSKNTMRHEGGSGTSNYWRNKWLILAGETYRSQKQTGRQKSPGSYRPRY